MKRKEWWQLKELNGTMQVYLYLEDKYCKKVLWYEGCMYGLAGKSYEEIALRAVLRGNVILFKNKPNVVKSMVQKKHIKAIGI